MNPDPLPRVPRRVRHRHVEHRHQHAAVRHFPAVQVRLGQVHTQFGVAVSAFFWMSNWVFVAQDTDYFSQGAPPSPLRVLRLSENVRSAATSTPGGIDLCPRGIGF